MSQIEYNKKCSQLDQNRAFDYKFYVPFQIYENSCGKEQPVWNFHPFFHVDIFRQGYCGWGFTFKIIGFGFSFFYYFKSNAGHRAFFTPYFGF